MGVICICIKKWSFNFLGIFFNFKILLFYIFYRGEKFIFVFMNEKKLFFFILGSEIYFCFYVGEKVIIVFIMEGDLFLFLKERN